MLPAAAAVAVARLLADDVADDMHPPSSLAQRCHEGQEQYRRYLA